MPLQHSSVLVETERAGARQAERRSTETALIQSASRPSSYDEPKWVFAHEFSENGQTKPVTEFPDCAELSVNGHRLASVDVDLDVWLTNARTRALRSVATRTIYTTISCNEIWFIECRPSAPAENGNGRSHFLRYLLRLSAHPIRAIGWFLYDVYGLSRREVHIILLLAFHASIARISERISISEHTIRSHLKHIYRKVGVRSQQELIRFVFEHLGI